MRLVLRPLLDLAIGAGILMAVWPIGQFCYGRWSQHQLEAQWNSQRNAQGGNRQEIRRGTQSRDNPVKSRPGGVTRISTDGSPAMANRAHGTKGSQHESSAGPRPRVHKSVWPLTKIRIPAIDLVAYVVQGQEPADLRRGPGHDEDSGLPGQGNCVISGHRNTFGSYFLRLDEVQPGAPVILETPQRTFTYTLRRSFNTPDSNLTVLAPPAPGQLPELTLVTCTLPHTNERIVLQCDLDQTSD